jgi:predicted phosphodiesterase
MSSSQDAELVELYDSLSILYDSLPAHTATEWKLALKSVLYGGDLLAENATCYGKQQNERNHGKRRDYQRTRGNGDRITEFSAIRVREPRSEDKKYLPSGAVVPVAPDSGTVLPVEVSQESVDQAISLLAEFPVEPAADKPGIGVDVLLDPVRVQEARSKLGPRPHATTETTVLFVSDTHLGYENRAKTHRGSRVSWIGELSSSETLKRIRDTAIARDVDAVIHTGDILDHEVDRDTLAAVESALDALSVFDIPVYCIIGSHDHDSYEPHHPESVNGIAWLKSQTRSGDLTELSTSPSVIGDGALNVYGIPAGNVGINDVGTYQSRSWSPADIEFEPASQGLNVLCLHDGLTPYRDTDADVDLDQLLAHASVSFDCVLIGDEHRPKNKDFDAGYTFETGDGTPVFYTGPAMRISEPYRDRDAFVTELTMTADDITMTQHRL